MRRAESEAHQIAGCGFDHLYHFHRLQLQNADMIFKAAFNKLLKKLHTSSAVPLAEVLLHPQQLDLDMSQSRALLCKKE